MASFHCDHIHFRASDVSPVVEFFEKMFDAEIFSEGEMNGFPFIRMKLGDVDLTISGPPEGVTDLHPTAGKIMSGIDHIAFGVDDLDTVAADLKTRGAKFITEPIQSNPNLKISFIEGPVGIRVEILQRM